MSQRFIQLGPAEMISDRPFTDPVDSLTDLDTLHDMLDTLRQCLSPPSRIPPLPRPYIFFVPESSHHYHRIALARVRTLLTSEMLYVVGFCGKKRSEADRGPVDAVDAELIREFPQHPDLVSYSTLLLTPDDSCNLVLFSKLQGLAHWAQSMTHARATALAPHYYHCIRLHNAQLSGGLMSGQALVLRQTKYFDYSDGTPWTAMRELHAQE